jgi:hypothetical protein
MKYEYYPAAYITDDLSIFEFISSGKRGNIRKRILFQPTDFHGVYNLAFGDLNAEGGIDDQIVTDNGDRNRILATIVRSIDLYTAKYPRRWVYFKGNTNGKTRLYRMAVTLHFEELSAKFEIYCRVDAIPEYLRFEKDMAVSGFLIKRKLGPPRKIKIAGKKL